MWTIHPVLSRNVMVRNVTVHSTLYNTDGCDVEASSFVHITGCRFDTNDDCVAVKSGRDEDGHRVGVPSTNIVVEHCKFSRPLGRHHVGSEMSGGVRNVFARDCEINPADFPGKYPVKYPLYIEDQQAARQLHRRRAPARLHRRPGRARGPVRHPQLQQPGRHPPGTGRQHHRRAAYASTARGARSTSTAWKPTTSPTSRSPTASSPTSGRPNTVNFTDNLVLRNVRIDPAPVPPLTPTDADPATAPPSI